MKHRKEAPKKMFWDRPLFTCGGCGKEVTPLESAGRVIKGEEFRVRFLDDIEYLYEEDWGEWNELKKTYGKACAMFDLCRDCCGRTELYDYSSVRESELNVKCVLENMDSMTEQQLKKTDYEILGKIPPEVSSGYKYMDSNIFRASAGN